MKVVDERKTTAGAKDRMHFRLDPEVRRRVSRAAAITGQGLTAFAVAALSERANEILERHESILLDRNDYRVFLEALEEKGKPSRRALVGAARYRRGHRTGVRYNVAD